MSFILDALKKSETDRQEQGSADFADVPTGDDSRGPPRWLWVLALLLAINLAVLLGLLLRDGTPEDLEPAPGDQLAESMPAEGDSFTEQLQEVRDRQPTIAAAVRTDTGAASQATPAQTAPAEVTPAPQPGFTLGALPTADELRANGTIQMADLHLDIHVYSEVPADRFVFINMVRHGENSKLAEGPVVKEITPEGVILNYSGTEFLLPRE
jgi:general secretion pathway protein B